MEYYLKARVDSADQSEKLQGVLFSLNCKWPDGSVGVRLQGEKYLYVIMVDGEKSIYTGIHDRFFDECAAPEWELTETVVYGISRVREKVSIGGKLYYEDEVKEAIRNLKEVA